MDTFTPRATDFSQLNDGMTPSYQPQAQDRDENPLLHASFTQLVKFVTEHRNRKLYFVKERLDRKVRGKAIMQAFSKLTVPRSTGCCKTEKNELLKRLPNYACSDWFCPLCWSGKKDACGADQVMFRIASHDNVDEEYERICLSVGQALAFYILEALPKSEEESVYVGDSNQ